MADNKKYYYLKLKENFFESDTMVILESMPDGYLYSNILMKLYLRSLKNEGKLMFNDKIPYNPTILSQVTRHSVGVIEKAVKIFKDLDLIEIMDNGAIYMLDIQNYIGESSTEADRKREYRNRIESERLLTSGQMSGQISDKTPPEIEIDTEQEIKKDIIPYAEIIDYLNLKTNSKYKHDTDKTRSCIKARWGERFRLDDFKKVIDIKTAEWLNTDMAKFLRPETLFGNKFEGYLNQKPSQPQQKPKVTNFTERKYDGNALEKAWLNSSKGDLMD